MKKNISSCVAIVMTFLVGFVLGMWAHASRDTIAPGDVPMCDGAKCPINTDVAQARFIPICMIWVLIVARNQVAIVSRHCDKNPAYAGFLFI